MLRAATTAIVIGVLSFLPAAAQEPPTKAQEPTATSDTSKTSDSAANSKSQEKLTDAERISRLQRTIEENEELLTERKAQLDAPEGEYVKAEAEFGGLDKEQEAKKKELQKLEESGSADEVAALKKDLEALQQRWKLARERFDLAIQERKTLQEQVATLEQKLQQDRDALNKLLAPPSTQPVASQPASSGPAQPAAETPSGKEAAPQPTESQTTVPGVSPPVAGQPAQEPAAKPAEAEKPVPKELQEAQQKLEQKQSEVAQAEEAVKSITDRIDQLQKEIALEREQMKLDRQKADNALETERTLGDQLDKLIADGAPADQIRELRKKIGEAKQRFRDTRAAVTKRVDRMDQLQDQLQELQAEHIDALEKAEGLRKEQEGLKSELDALTNPFSPRNLLQWLIDHGPKVVGIVVAMLVLLWLTRVLEARLVALIASRSGPGTSADKEDRAKTLVSVFRHAATLVISIGGILMILSEVGLPIGPLLGGAAVIGLAIAFGAQNLVRDYFTGFMILLEDQYSINDVIKVAGVAGLVERITLRVTVLRDLEGTVHFVPNGQITTVSNLTHGWSRVVLDIGVAYKEDVDRVMEVMKEVGKEICDDPQYRALVLDNLEVLGVDAFGDSAVVIKAILKTRPLQQWTIKRAMMRRLKQRFDELGIEIPFPHRTIFHHYETGAPQPPAGPPPVK